MTLRHRVTAVVVAAIGSIALTTPSASAADGDFQVIAHRGYHSATTENSLAAFRLAKYQGADASETDLRLTRDGYIVAMHDRRWDRTSSCTGWVHNWRKRGVRRRCRLDNGQRIPFAVNVLNKARFFGYNMVFEIKADPLNRWTTSKLQTLVSLIDSKGMRDRVMFLSFERDILQRLESIAPDMSTIVINETPDQGTAGADYMSVWAQNAEQVTGTTFFGREADDIDSWQLFRSAGARGVITDSVQECVSWLSTSG